jgi:hypothetical protein
MQQSNEEQLRARAYAIWEREGCPAGKEQEHWDLAVKEMSGQAAPKLGPGPWRTPQELGPQSTEPTSEPLSEQQPTEAVDGTGKPPRNRS